MLARTLPGHAAAVLRHRRRAHAACSAAPHAACRCVALSLCCGCEDNGRGTPSARAPATRRLPLGCARGHCLSSPQPSREPQRYAVSAAVGGPVNAACGQVAPASCWAASSFDSPVGRRNGPSLRFGLLALAPSAPEGPKVCSRLRPLHGFFQCFRPGRCAAAGAPQVLSRVAQPPSIARRALDRF